MLRLGGRHRRHLMWLLPGQVVEHARRGRTATNATRRPHLQGSQRLLGRAAKWPYSSRRWKGTPQCRPAQPLGARVGRLPWILVRHTCELQPRRVGGAPPRPSSEATESRPTTSSSACLVPRRTTPRAVRPSRRPTIAAPSLGRTAEPPDRMIRRRQGRCPSGLPRQSSPSSDARTLDAARDQGPSSRGTWAPGPGDWPPPRWRLETQPTPLR